MTIVYSNDAGSFDMPYDETVIDDILYDPYFVRQFCNVSVWFVPGTVEGER